MRFDPVAGPDDILAERADAGFSSLPHEQMHAQRTGAVAPEILAEQAKLRRADLVILQFPLWWFGMPAILKG